MYTLETLIIDRPKPHFQSSATCFGLTQLHFGSLIRNERCFAQQIVGLSVSLFVSLCINKMGSLLLGLNVFHCLYNMEYLIWLSNLSKIKVICDYSSAQYRYVQYMLCGKSEINIK